MCALVRNDISFTPHPNWVRCFFLHVHGRVHKVDILGIQLLTEQLHRLTEALEVDHLALPEELNNIVYIRIVAESENVVIGDAGFLFCCYLI